MQRFYLSDGPLGGVFRDLCACVCVRACVCVLGEGMCVRACGWVGGYVCVCARAYCAQIGKEECVCDILKEAVANN